MILINAEEKAFDADEPTETKVRNHLHRLLVKSDDHDLVLLQANPDSGDVFAGYVRDGASFRDLPGTGREGMP